ncbi:MAG: zf-HC2 domain-containing protein [Acidobacteria bacterium]|nr:zf-HC2 domain-containing protein [Acidobacteriota bacterium]
MSDRSSETLRRAFAAGGGAAPAGECPAPEAIFDAVHGGLPPEERRAVVEHVTGCAACAADWQLAASPGEDTAGAPRGAVRGPWSALLPLARFALPVAAVVAIAFGLYVAYRVRQPVAPVAELRADEHATIRTLLDPARALPRGRALLRWTAAGENARYSIEVATEDLRPVTSAHGLEATEYLVPAEALAAVPPGGTIAWKVEARLPDGRRVSSTGFLNRVE